MNAVRLRLTSVAVLAVYLTVNIGVGAAHHHSPAAPASGRTDTTSACPVVQSGTSHVDADDQDCPICNALHLVKNFRSPEVAVVALIDRGEAVVDATSCATHAFLSSARSRAPPAV
jgi:hypothetical protein